ncbi:hypothetical protein AXA74_16895 [Bordetella hinzii LMG 13501]|nr:hypothetical protein AXA74_16895 [Bordetella hinzii LMG 13501]
MIGTLAVMLHQDDVSRSQGLAVIERAESRFGKVRKVKLLLALPPAVLTLKIWQRNIALTRVPIANDGIAIQHSVLERTAQQRCPITFRTKSANLTGHHFSIFVLADRDDEPRQTGRLASHSVGRRWRGRCVRMAVDDGDDTAHFFGSRIILRRHAEMIYAMGGIAAGHITLQAADHDDEPASFTRVFRHGLGRDGFHGSF